MLENNKELSIKTWNPDDLIYDYDTPSFHAYYIIEGEVNIFTPKGLRLNSIGPSEIFGEASLLLDKKRSVTARAGKYTVKAQLIPKNMSSIYNKVLLFFLLYFEMYKCVL